jgi:hypothetical protein
LNLKTLKKEENVETEPPQKRLKLDPRKQQDEDARYHILLGCFDGKYYLIDHCQIDRIVNPNLESTF